MSFFDTTTWGKLATTCAEYLTKRRGVRAVGRRERERWEDGQGNPRARVVVIAEHVEFKPRRRPEAEEGVAAAGDAAEVPAEEDAEALAS